MSSPAAQPRRATERDLLFFSTPALWNTWPFLAVVRHHADGEDDCGVLCDFRNTTGRCGYTTTVFLENFFLLPETEQELLELPKEVFDTTEELASAGWTID